MVQCHHKIFRWIGLNPIKGVILILLWTGVLGGLLKGVGLAHDSSPEKDVIKSPAGDQAFIRIDYLFFRKDSARYSRLNTKGMLETLHYQPNKKKVTRKKRVMLHPSELRSVLKYVDALKSLDTKDPIQPQRNGLSRGDQFYLFVKGGNGLNLERFGFIDDAPDTIAALLRFLLLKRERVDERPLSTAYLRCEKISPDHLQRIKKRNKIRFQAISELPANIKYLLRQSIVPPRHFFPLSKAQLRGISKITSLDQDMFVTEKMNAFQLSFFTTKSQ